MYYLFNQQKMSQSKCTCNFLFVVNVFREWVVMVGSYKYMLAK